MHPCVSSPLIFCFDPLCASHFWGHLQRTLHLYTSLWEYDLISIGFNRLPAATIKSTGTHMGHKKLWTFTGLPELRFQAPWSGQGIKAPSCEQCTQWTVVFLTKTPELGVPMTAGWLGWLKCRNCPLQPMQCLDGGYPADCGQIVIPTSELRGLSGYQLVSTTWTAWMRNVTLATWAVGKSGIWGCAWQEPTSTSLMPGSE